jgi:vacuolar-type H+-ATPase subunit F/Vma7
MQGKVAVIGDADFVLPFSAMGVDTFMAGDTAEQAVQAAQKIIEGRYTLVVVAENKARAVEQTFAGVQSMPTPCVVVVPFTTEPEGFATRALGKLLKMATGISIMESNQQS